MDIGPLPLNPQYRGREVWGILGGMGPLASAEFLQTIYQESAGAAEQDLPTVLLLSDPTVPDRTENLLNGREDILLDTLKRAISQLFACGATKIVVCCVTIHALFPKLPASWQPKIISLMDVIFEAVLKSNRRHLLIATDGARRTRLFERHRLWPAASHLIVLPTPEDQFAIHTLLYETKMRRHGADAVLLLEDMLRRYDVHSYIVGCTEAHILAKTQERLPGGDRRAACIDPLASIAPMIAGRVCVNDAVGPSTR